MNNKIFETTGNFKVKKLQHKINKMQEYSRNPFQELYDYIERESLKKREQARIDFKNSRKNNANNE